MTNSAIDNATEIAFTAGTLLKDNAKPESAWPNSRDLKEALSCAAYALAKLEEEDPDMWDKFNWVLTCDTISFHVLTEEKWLMSANDVRPYLQDR
jgi:hypothetical protein